VLADAAIARSPALRVRPLQGANVATIRHGNVALSLILSNALMVADQCCRDNYRYRKRVL
jgi:hypothetical protein